MAVGGVIYLAFAWSHQIGDGLSLYRGPLLLCGIAAVAVIAAAAHPKPGPVARALALPPLVGLGLISYGLYLFHWPVYLVLTPARTGLSGWALLAERVSVSIAVAIASYYLIEQPIRHGVLRPARAIVVLGTATAIVATALVVSTKVTPIAIPAAAVTRGGSGAGGPSLVSGPWPRPVALQVPAESVRGYLPTGDWSRLTNTCDVNHPPPPVRRIGATAAPKLLLLGDSVGCFIGASLDINQVRDGVVTLNRARLGCPMVAPGRARVD